MTPVIASEPVGDPRNAGLAHRRLQGSRDHGLTLLGTYADGPTVSQRADLAFDLSNGGNEGVADRAARRLARGRPLRSLTLISLALDEVDATWVQPGAHRRESQRQGKRAPRCQRLGRRPPAAGRNSSGAIAADRALPRKRPVAKALVQTVAVERRKQ